MNSTRRRERYAGHLSLPSTPHTALGADARSILASRWFSVATPTLLSTESPSLLLPLVLLSSLLLRPSGFQQSTDRQDASHLELVSVLVLFAHRSQSLL